MILYHGSNIIVDKIDLRQSKSNKDFGRGFYLSDSYSQALEFAQFKSLQLGGNPCVSVFEFDYEGIDLYGLKSKEFSSYSEEWVDFIIANRQGNIKHDFDYVFGPIADDKVGRQLRLYKDEDITKEQLIERLKYFKGLTFQYYFGTEKSLKLLNRVYDGEFI